MTDFWHFVVHLLFGLLAVIGAAVAVVGGLVNGELGLFLLGLAVLVCGLAGYAWLGE